MTSDISQTQEDTHSVTALGWPLEQSDSQVVPGTEEDRGVCFTGTVSAWKRKRSGGA